MTSLRVSYLLSSVLIVFVTFALYWLLERVDRGPGLYVSGDPIRRLPG